MIVLLLVFLIFSLILAIKKPTYFIILYLLATTRFLGFLNLDNILVNGYAIAFLLLNTIAFIGIFTTKSALNISKKLFIFILVILFLLFHGMFYPYYMGFSDVLKSIIAGKDFFYYFLLLYLLGRKSSINVTLILQFIKFIGLYLSIVLIINLLTGIAPPLYEAKYFIINSLEVYYFTYISLAIFIFYNDWNLKQIKFNLFVFYILILLTGLIIGQHFSIVATTIGGLFFLYTIGKKNRFNIKSFLLRVIILSSFIFVTLVSFNDLRIKMFNSVEQIVSGTDVALVSRDRVNQFRWDAIKQEPIFGYGFIHPSSPIMQSIGSDLNNKYTIGLGLVDAGYVDLLIKFGYFGTLLILLFFGFYIVRILMNISRYTILQVIMATYLMQYYAVNYTWSVFSYAHGIVPASIAIFLMLYTQNGVIEKRKVT